MAIRFFNKFFKHELAIDLGTVNTIIYEPDRGLLLNEPSVVAIDRYNGEVISVGSQALKLLGREPRGIEVHRPIRSGTIFNFDVTQKMLRSFLGRVMDGYRRGHFVVGIPGSSTAVEQRSVRAAVSGWVGSSVDLVDEGLAAGLGAGISFEDERAHLIIDIGGGTTNIAIIASGGVINSMSFGAAGNAMDESIRDYIRSKHCVHIGECSAEELKKKLGALVDDTDLGIRDMEVVGKHLIDGSPRVIKISSREVREAIEPILGEIVGGVRKIIEEAQPEAVADIFYSGITLAGGGSLLKGTKERLQSELKLQVSTPDDPTTTVAIGAGLLMTRPDKLSRSAVRHDVPVWQDSEELVVSW